MGEQRDQRTHIHKIS